MNKFETLAFKLIDEAWGWAENVPSTLYHYTNAAGLIGILTSKSVWATEYRFMNDDSEVELGRSRADNYIKDELVATQVAAKQRFLKRLQLELSNRNTMTSYVVSLTECKDDLSQWRGYANDGYGFTIGVDAKILKSISENGNSFSFGKVCYDSSQYDRKVRSVVNEFYKLLTTDEKFTKTDLFSACRQCETVIASYAASYKHSSFEGEKEWRIHNYPSSPDIKVRSSGLKLIPYYVMQFEEEKESHPFPLKSIGIGPSFKNVNYEYPVSKLLSQANLQAKIYNANTPCRVT